MFHVKIRYRGRSSTWVCPLSTVRVVVICLTLITLKSKSSRPMEISSAGVFVGRWRVTTFIVIHEFRKKVK
jgi:hypothetical protein